MLFAALFPVTALWGQTPATSYALKVAQSVNWMENLYVDTLDWNRFSEQMIRDALQKLDPHSAYITADQARQANEPLQGRFDGIGVSFGLLDDTIVVVSVLPGGPSYKAGLLPEDRIVKVDEKTVAGVGIRSADIYNLFRGVRGSEVMLEVRRPGSGKNEGLRVVRDRIPINSIEAAYEIAPDIAYIKLSRFSSTSVAEFRNALRNFGKEKPGSLILDLTGNGGGYLETVVDLANEFLADRQIIVYTEGAKQPRREYRADGAGSYTEGNLVVLIDQNSASASEILAGAIQDWDRGLLIGRRSYGKGLVQRQLGFSDGSMIRLTVARYHTPSGRVIQKPYTAGNVEYRREIFQRNDTALYAPDSLRYLTMKEKRPVYGGGGISPDIHIPMDTSFVTAYGKQLVSQGVTALFELRYLMQHREQILKKYPDVEAFVKGFEWSGDDLQLLVFEGSQRGIDYKPDEFLKDRNNIALLLKAVLARDIWDMEAFYRVYNQDNPMIKEAVRSLKNWRQTARTIGLD